jgi:hypothetical protein
MMSSENNIRLVKPCIQATHVFFLLLLISSVGCTVSDSDEANEEQDSASDTVETDESQGEDVTDMTTTDGFTDTDDHGGNVEVDAVASDHNLSEGDMGHSMTLSDDFEAGLIHMGGCADTQLYAYNESGDIALGFYNSGPLERAGETGSIEETLDAASGDFTLKVEIGVDVHVNYCTDALMVLDIWSTYEAVSGQAVLSMETMLGGPDGEADLQLTDVLLVNEVGHEVMIESFAMEDVWVSAFWGG